MKRIVPCSSPGSLSLGAVAAVPACLWTPDLPCSVGSAGRFRNSTSVPAATTRAAPRTSLRIPCPFALRHLEGPLSVSGRQDRPDAGRCVAPRHLMRRGEVLCSIRGALPTAVPSRNARDPMGRAPRARRAGTGIESANRGLAGPPPRRRGRRSSRPARSAVAALRARRARQPGDDHIGRREPVGCLADSPGSTDGSPGWTPSGPCAVRCHARQASSR